MHGLDVRAKGYHRDLDLDNLSQLDLVFEELFDPCAKALTQVGGGLELKFRKVDPFYDVVCDMSWRSGEKEARVLY
jgi:hypothetical protein